MSVVNKAYNKIIQEREQESNLNRVIFLQGVFSDMAKALALVKLNKYDESLRPRGLLKKRCPLCGSILNHYAVESGWQALADVWHKVGLYPHGGELDKVAIHYYKCPNDNYRFPIKLKYTWELINNI